MTNRRRPSPVFGWLVALSAAGLAVAPTARAQNAPAPPPASAPPSPAPAPPPAAAPLPPPVSEPPPAPEAAPGYGPGYGYGYAPPYYRRPRYYYPPMAAPIDPSDAYHTHDGFYLHVHAGISATSLSSKTAGVKTSYDGGGGSFGAAVGGTIAHNLILYGAFFGTDTGNPDKQVSGASVTSDFGEIGVGGFGPGLAYYFDRFNLYISGTFGLVGFVANDGNGFKLDSSKSGAALDLTVGKEWWVSHDWGLGIAGELLVASMKDQNTPGLTWSASGLSVLFSATYN